MNAKKIKELLKKYGLDDEKINNFMNELNDDKDIKENKNGLFDNDNINKLKSNDKGKDILLRAPEMKREELEKAIAEFLANYVSNN